MSTAKIQAIILAAGKSSRFNTSKTKLSYKISGQEIIAYPVKLLKNLNIETLMVVGHQKEIVQDIVKKYCDKVTFIEQEKQLGTGDALKCTQNYWSSENILIINGDMPLITQENIKDIINLHLDSNSTITFATAFNPDPNQKSYGRVIRNGQNIEIIEPKDFKLDPNLYCDINAGIYIINKEFLNNKINTLQNNNSTAEWYLPDLIKIANNHNEKISTFELPFDRVRGINTLKELWIAEHIKKSEIIEYWMENGVYFQAPLTNYIDINVEIKKDSIIGCCVQLLDRTSIGQNCKIDAFSIISNSQISDNVMVKPHSVITDSIIYENAQVGPFAHIRNESTLHSQVNIGNFVEVTKSVINTKSKAKHLAYIGNAQVGSQVNIGACSVTCNYNGISKNTTLIKDKAFIGSNTSLIAPVCVGQEAIVAAGSVITDNVPDYSLAIARANQVNKQDYANKVKDKIKKIAKIDQSKMYVNDENKNENKQQKEISHSGKAKSAHTDLVEA